jgi:hypothetical protein
MVLNQNDEGTTAMIDMKRAAMLGGDPADRKEASYWPTHEDKPEDIWADEWLEMCRRDDVRVCPDAVTHGKAAFVSSLQKTDNDQIRAAKRETVVELLRQIADLKNCPIDKLQYKADILLASFELSDLSATDIGRKYGLTRAAPSKQIVETRKKANPKTIARSQKSIEARKTYALRQVIVGATRKPKPKETQLQKESNLCIQRALQSLSENQHN